MSNSRIKNSVKNIISGLSLKFINIPLQLIIRVVIINYLGIEFIGLNSFMLSIINIITAIELGFGIAMTQSLYEPIKNNNQSKVNEILVSFKYIYNKVGIIVFSLGLIVLPFLNYFNSNNDGIDVNIYIVFVIYLLSSLINFFVFPHKIAIINANQKRNILHNVSIITKTLSALFQIIILVLFKDYYIFILSIVIFPLIRNLMISYYCSKYYPNSFPLGKVDKSYLTSIFTKTKKVAIHKFGDIALISVDTILIVCFLGYKTLSIYSNYIYLVTAINTTLDVISMSLLASVGNLLVGNNRKYRLFYKLSVVNAIIIGFISVKLFIIHQFFITIWLGEENLFESIFTVLLFSIYLFSTKIRSVLILYRDALGIWDKDFYKPIVGVFSNLILSLIFVNYFGVNGVLISSIIVLIVIYLPWEIIIVHKYIFSKKFIRLYTINIVIIVTLVILVFIINHCFYILIGSEISFPNLLARIIFSFVVFISLFYNVFKFHNIKSLILKAFKFRDV